MPRLGEKRPQLPHLSGTDISIEVAAPFQVAHQIPVLTFPRCVGGPESETALVAREEVEGEELPRPGASRFGALAADALQIQHVLVIILVHPGALVLPYVLCEPLRLLVRLLLQSLAHFLHLLLRGPVPMLLALLSASTSYGDVAYKARLLLWPLWILLVIRRRGFVW
ncbi:hypothetical protein PG996_005555 [Apiospora saccharicola]|uniref:Uncharacterized protein n=1 Tax=Apiospora saccharicola TaxID=335842 RepID=A0ABR1VM30_9PEZI